MHSARRNLLTIADAARCSGYDFVDNMRLTSGTGPPDLRNHGYPPDKQAKAAQIVPEPADVLSAERAAA